MKEEIKSHWHTWIFCISLAIVIIFIYKAIDSIGFILDGIKGFLSVISPFLVGILISYLLYIPESKIEGLYKNRKNKFFKKKARPLAILTTYIITILIIMILINVILPVVFESINELVDNVQIYYNKIIDTYNNLPEDSILKTDKVYEALKDLQNLDLKKYLNLSQITEYVKGAVSIAKGVFDVFVAFIVSVYILSERNEILDFFKRLSRATFKKDTNKFLEKYFFHSNKVFFKFISSQFVDAIIIGILTTIAMHIMGIKYATLLGFVIGLFNMIPYFGAIIAVLLATIITLITGGLSKAILLLIVVTILQQIDANVINPKIIGDYLKISPLVVILAVTIGGAYFGVIGMFLAVPIAAVLKILVNDYIDNSKQI